MALESHNTESPSTGVSKADLIAETKAMVASINNTSRQVATNLATMRDRHGMTQHDIGNAMGKTQPWVSLMLKWHDDGFIEETPFGSFSKASRERRKMEPTEYKATNNPPEPRPEEAPAPAPTNVVDLDTARPSSGDAKSDRNEAELMAAFNTHWPHMNATSRTRFTAHVLNKTKVSAAAS
jgi:hypothetical protein